MIEYFLVLVSLSTLNEVPPQFVAPFTSQEVCLKAAAAKNAEPAARAGLKNGVGFVCMRLVENT